MNTSPIQANKGIFGFDLVQWLKHHFYNLPGLQFCTRDSVSPCFSRKKKNPLQTNLVFFLFCFLVFLNACWVRSIHCDILRNIYSSKRRRLWKQQHLKKNLSLICDDFFVSVNVYCPEIGEHPFISNEPEATPKSSQVVTLPSLSATRISASWFCRDPFSGIARGGVYASALLPGSEWQQNDSEGECQGPLAHCGEAPL